MKIIAIGMNYSLHCHELHAGEALPQNRLFYEAGFCLAERQQAFFYSRFL